MIKMKNIGLLFAMNMEVPNMIPYTKPKQVEVFEVRDYNLGVIVSGMGQKKASDATQRLCEEFKPDYLISLGICGGARENINIGDLLVADSVHYKGDEIPLKSPQLGDVKRFLSENSIHYHAGKLQTFDYPVLSKEKVLDDVIGVDMESYAIANEASKPLVIVRAVSDIIPEKKPLFAALRLVYHVIRNFGVAKEGLNRFSQKYLQLSHQ